MSPTLTSLPSELIIKIFTSADNFSTAASLSGTCKLLNGIWKHNLTLYSLSNLLLPGMVLHLPQAQALVDTQLGVLHSKVLTHERVSERIKLLFQIQEIARKTYTQISGLPVQCENRFSRAAYIRAFYHLFNLRTKCTYIRQEKVIGLPLCILNTLSMLELQQIVAVADMVDDIDDISAWIRAAEIMPSEDSFFGMEDELVKIGGAETTSSEDQYLRNTILSLEKIGESIDDLLEDLETLSGLVIVEASSGQRLGVGIWHSYPDATDYKQAPLLADLLPRIADNSRDPYSGYKLV